MLHCEDQSFQNCSVLPRRTLCIDQGRVGDERFDVGQREGEGLARVHGELALGPEVFAAQLDGGLQDDLVGPRHGAQTVVRQHGHPWHLLAIAEAHHKFGLELDRALLADDEPHEVRMLLARIHEVDHRGGAGIGLEPRLEDERVRAVAPGHLRLRIGRRDQPAAIIVVAENRRETSSGVEARQAKPVDRTVASNERCGLAVADQSIIFDGEDHHVR